MTQPPIPEALASYRRAVEGRLPHRVLDVILFGSRARGDATPGSDYDLAVIIDADNEAARKAARRTLSHVAYDFVLDGVPIRPIAMTRDFLGSAAPLAAEIRRDGVKIG